MVSLGPSARGTTWAPRLAVAILVLLVVSPRVHAETKTLAELTEQLRSATDFRVRTQAALALGATSSPGALEPLCGALDDLNDTVRGAAAAALGKLARADANACLKRHATDANPSVRSVIERSLGMLGKGADASAKPPPPGPGDTYYVAIGPVADKTGRGDDSVAVLVRSAMQQKLLSLGGYAVAQADETPAAAKRTIAKHRLKGALLQTRVEPLRLVDGTLTVQVRVTLWTYPGKSLQGEFSPRISMSGVTPGSTTSEDELIKMAVESAVDSFASIAPSR